MYGVIVVIVVQLILRSEPVLSDTLTVASMLSKSLASVVDSWLSPLDNLVVIYGGFDVEIRCLENDKNDDSKQAVAGNKSYVWYDNDNKTVRPPLTAGRTHFAVLEPKLTCNIAKKQF